MEKINRTLKRALDVLQLIKDSEKPLTTHEVSSALNIPESSTFDIIRTLYVEGYLENSSDGLKSYVLGPKVFEIGTAYLNNTSISKIARPYVEKLMKYTNATAFLAVENNGQIIYLDKIEAPTSVRTSAELGSRQEMYCTGLGKSILSLYPDEKVRKIFENTKIQALTEHTIINIDDLMKDLNKARERGYAIDDREGNIYVRCVACAIRDSSREPVAAISVAMMYSAVDEAILNKYGNKVKEYAKEISHKLGYIE